MLLASGIDCLKKLPNNIFINMKVSLIISTYNNLDFLNLCLKSVSELKYMPDEVVIADDGSTEETKILVDSYRSKISVPVVHVWQEDKGFRKCMIWNKVIAKAKGEYIIQIDGDLILNPYFVYDHLKMAKPNTYLQGTRVMLSEQESKILIDKKSFAFLPKGMKSIRILCVTNLVSRIIKHKYYKSYAKGVNMSFYRDDLIKINGYDEDFVGWGLEDEDIALRMQNGGVVRKFIKFCAIGYHLYHGDETRPKSNSNSALLNKHQEDGTVECENGITKIRK